MDVFFNLVLISKNTFKRKATDVAFFCTEPYQFKNLIFTIKIIDRMILAPILDKHQG